MYVVDMVQSKSLTQKQLTIVEGKLKGKKQRQIGCEVYPGQTPGSAAVSVSRELRNANVQEYLQEALSRHGITIDEAVKPIGEALKATKVVIMRDRAASKEESANSAFAEEVSDHATRLRASAMALGLLLPKTPDSLLQVVQYNQLVQEQRQTYKL